MTVPESPAVLLRRAASLIEKRATEATPGPWRRPLDTRTKSDVTADLPKGEQGWRTTGLMPDGSREQVGVVQCNTWSDGSFYRSRSGRDLEYIALVNPMVGSQLAVMLRASADRWDEDNTLDRPESGEMQPSYPEAWFCGTCQGAIESPDYPDEDQRCYCGWWSDMLAIARVVLGETDGGEDR